MKTSSLAPLIDHTFLKAAGSRTAIARLCREAKTHHFASVCVNGACVREAARLLKGTPVKVCAVVGFPLGQTTTSIKIAEARAAIADGATELDFVINVRLLKYDAAACEKELRAIVKAVRAVRTGLVLKLILECAELTKKEIVLGSRLAKKVGFDFVKTSTGFGAGGATEEDVRLMRQTVGPNMGVKAAGGIRDAATARRMVAAGATRLGCSAGVEICKQERHEK